MGIFVDAVNKGNVTYNNGIVIVDTTYDLGDGDHKVDINGTGTNVKTGNGDCSIKHTGSNASITTGDGNQHITSLGNNKIITTGDGNQHITALGDNKTITTGNGDDDIVFIGDNYKLDAGNGNNNVVFWGDNCDIKLGNGNDKVTTYDQVMNHAAYDDIADYFIDKLPTGTWERWTKVSTDLIDTNVRKHTFKTKITNVYENHYDVETTFSRYINGVKNTNIDLGEGTNTANVTLHETSSIEGTENDTIVKNDKWQIDNLVNIRDEGKLSYTTRKKTNWSCIGRIAATVTGGLAGLYLYTKGESLLNIAKGNDHTKDYILLGL